MSYSRPLSFLPLAFLSILHGPVDARLSDYVDLLIGTEGPTPGSGIAGGNTFPGAVRRPPPLLLISSQSTLTDNDKTKALPWGMAKAGIDTSYIGLNELATDCNAGYSPLGNVTGVSMLHVTGTGGNPTYGLVSQMPLAGTLASVNIADNNTYAQNRSLASETASVGHFSTTLLDGIQIDITAANHSSIIRYTFPPPGTGNSNSGTPSSLASDSPYETTKSDDDVHVLVDLTHALPAQNPGTQSYTQQFLRGDVHVRAGPAGQPSYYGSATYTGGWPNPEEHRYFFCGNFSAPGSDSSPLVVPTNAYAEAVGFDRVDGAGTFSWPYSAFERPADAPSVRSDTDVLSAAGNRMGIGALFSWSRSAAAAAGGSANATAVLEARVGISHISVAKACGYIESEIPAARSFEDIVEQARQEWESKVLSAVEVVDDGGATGQNDTLKRMLYTALYQSALMPTDKTGESPSWVSNDTFPYYDDHYTIWDTYRTLLPMYHLLFTGTYARVIKGLINIFSFEGFLPAGRAANWNGRVQGGTHADLVLGDAFAKSVRSPAAGNLTAGGLGELGDVDWAEAYAAMVKDAEVLPARNADSVAFDGATKEGRGALDDYLRLGYVTRNHSRSISRGLEYAQDDFAVWAVARGLGAPADEQARYLARAGWWQNQWNADANTSLALSGNGTNTTFVGFAGPRDADGTFNL